MFFITLRPLELESNLLKAQRNSFTKGNDDIYKKVIYFIVLYCPFVNMNKRVLALNCTVE